MQPIGIILVLIGGIAMLVRSFTFFTTDTVVGPGGLFLWDVQQPHTFFFSPVAGLIAIAIGIMLIMLSSPRERAV